jgi:hypothetical protein
MLPVVFGAVAAVGLATLLRSGRSGQESFGHHLGGEQGFTSLGMDGHWDVYRYEGPSGGFTVAMYPSPTGDYPRPSGTNVEFVYADGTPGRTVRACGQEGQKWSCIDLSGRRIYDLFVYHPAFHPRDFPGLTSMEFGAVSYWMGGRGPGAGTGISSMLGGRQVAVPYAFSSATESGYENFRAPPAEDPQAEWSEAMGTWVDQETGQVWDETMGWIPGDEGYGINILGLNIPLAKEERLERFEEKIDAGKEKLQELEKAAHAEGADLDKIARQIASIQTQIEHWEDKRDKIEMRMGGTFGADDDLDDDLDDDDDLVDDEEDYGLFEDLIDQDDDLFGIEE